MPQTCSICKHPEREAIESAVIAGTSLRNVAKQFSCSATAVYRHKEFCVKPLIQEMAAKQEDSVAEQEEQSVFNALSEMEWMRTETRGIYSEVRKDRDYRVALQALAELRRQNELCAKLVGELDERSITITAIPEWRELRALLLDALSLHPQAKMAVILALEAYDHAQSA